MGDTQIVCDKIECLTIILNFGVEPCEVEPVKDILLFDLTKVFVSFGG
jgi:hypothetical protein